MLRLCHAPGTLHQTPSLSFTQYNAHSPRRYIFWFFMWTIIWNGGEITLVNQKEGLGAVKAELFCLLSGRAVCLPLHCKCWMLVCLYEKPGKKPRIAYMLHYNWLYFKRCIAVEIDIRCLTCSQYKISMYICIHQNVWQVYETYKMSLKYSKIEDPVQKV